MLVGGDVLDAPSYKSTNFRRGDHWSSALFRLCFALRANTVRPYRFAVAVHSAFCTLNFAFCI